jgi:Transposase, Mutator family
MTSARKSDQAAAEGGQPGREAAELELARQLAERAQAEGLQLTGPGGLLGRLTKVVLEGALEGELDARLGYAKHGTAGRDGGNSRNGHRAKTVLTDVGPVEISAPRDRDASFAPAIVAKRQRRLGGVGSRGLDDYFTRDHGCNIGAEIMGRNKFGPQRGPWQDHDWKGWWGDTPPFHTPVFVLTHHDRPSFTLSDTTFHFLNATPAEALR